jgi:hypothetical protein
MLPVVRDRPAPRGHEGLLAGSDDHRRSGIESWVGSALDRQEKLLAVAAPVGADIGTTWSEGSLTTVDPDDLRDLAQPVELLQAARAEGFHGLGVLIWADAVITATSRDTHAEIEAVLADLCRDHPVSVLCLYDRDGNSGDRDATRGAGSDHLDLAVARHPDGLHEQHLTLRRSADALQVGGEVDMVNLDVLAAALRALTHAPPDTVRIDLRRVSFLAAAAARALTVETADYRDRGGLVEIHATRHTTRVLQLLDLHTLPQIRLMTPFGPSPGPV